MKTASLMLITILLSIPFAFSEMPKQLFPAEKKSGFSYDNREVNCALIALYEDNPMIWKTEQLGLIGLCYVAEKRFDEAQKIFEELNEQDPLHSRFLEVLGSIHHVKGEFAEASKLYEKAWSENFDLDALRQLVVLKMETNDIDDLSPRIEVLLAHQDEDAEIQKVLLAYGVMLDDKVASERIYQSVIPSIRLKAFNENPDLRKLVFSITACYLEDE